MKCQNITKNLSLSTLRSKPSQANHAGQFYPSFSGKIAVRRFPNNYGFNFASVSDHCINKVVKIHR